MQSPLPDSRGDQLGVLLDSPEKSTELLTRGYHALLPQALGLKGSEQALHLDVLPGKILAIDTGEVHVAPSPTPLLRRFLEVLQKGPASKEELITQVWGHAYHPLRHDPLLYATALSLRRMLGKKSHWLETTEDGYRLHPHLRIYRARQRREKDFQTKSDGPGLQQGLNHRQLKLLSQLKAEDYVHVKSYMKTHKTSEITACRDLASLCRQGYLIRSGRARATRYSLAPQRIL
jgi:DNA-binding winged helix-turn-helix (wHTH) protein